jgi:hypothetical protein
VDRNSRTIHAAGVLTGPVTANTGTSAEAIDIAMEALAASRCIA